MFRHKEQGDILENPKVPIKRRCYKATNSKLGGDNFFYALSLFAQKKSIDEIGAILKQEKGVTISVIGLKKFKARNLDLIEQEQGKILSTVMQNKLTPVAVEQIRLERDEALFQLSQTLDKPKDKIDYGLKCIKEAREETKGDGSKNYIQFNQYNELSDKEILEKIKKVKQSIIDVTKKEGEVYASEIS